MLGGFVALLCACESESADPLPFDQPDTGGGGTTSQSTSAGGDSNTGGMTGAGGNGQGGTITGGAGPVFQVENLYGRSWIRYAEVQKTAAPPTVFIEASAIDSIPQSGAFPDGTLILRAEDYEPNDWNFYLVKNGGVWEQNSFYANETPNFDNPTSSNSCAGSVCHGYVSDMIITHTILRRFTTTGEVEQPGCDIGGNGLCPDGTYD